MTDYVRSEKISVSITSPPPPERTAYFVFGVGSGDFTNLSTDPQTAKFTPPQTVKTTLYWTQGKTGYVRIYRCIVGVSSKTVYEDWKQVSCAYRYAGSQSETLGAYLTMDENVYVYFRIYEATSC